jgi:hypothetical protein
LGTAQQEVVSKENANQLMEKVTIVEPQEEEVLDDVF